MAKERNVDGPCKSCIHWEDIHEKDAGECHRYPPKPIESGSVLWPITDGIDWCGEYEPKN